MKLTVSDNFDGLTADCNKISRLTGKGKSIGWFACIRGKPPQKHHYLDIHTSDLRKRGWIIVFDENEDAPVVSIRPSDEGEGRFHVRTGNFIGNFKWDKTEIEITSRFPDAFMKRILNVANDVFLDDVDAMPVGKSKELDMARLVIYYLFVQRLEKAFLLGLPKSYQVRRHHDLRLRGKVDINRFIRRDIPFQGRISSVSRELLEDQAIVDVLDRAVRVIEKHGRDLTQHIRQVKAHLRENRSGQPMGRETLRRARDGKALRNPIYAPYRKVLDYAEIILSMNGIGQASSKEKAPGFLVNVADLFETYLRKLLQRHFPDWQVESPKPVVYEGAFYERHLIPDIVMERDGRVMVFDAKYKRMKMRGRTQDGMGDVDREDFFQIHTYMSLYAGMDKKQLIAGGLLYPMEEHWEEICKSAWLGGGRTRFVVDGIDLSGVRVEEKEKAVKGTKQQKGKKADREGKRKQREAIQKAIQKAEEEFIGRIKVLAESQ